MIYSIILVSTFGLILLIGYFSSKSGFSYRNGKILLTTIPMNAIDDEDVQRIRKNALKDFKLLHLSLFVLSFVMFFIKNDFEILIYIGELFGYIIAGGFLSNKYVKQMRKLKKEKNFASFTRKYVDIAVTKEIDKQKLPFVAWIIPLIVFVGGYLIFGTFADMEFLMFISFGSTLIAISCIGLFWKNSGVKIVSENREKNLYINKVRIIKFQNKVFTIVNLYAVLFLALLFLQNIDKYSWIPFILYIVFVTIFVFYIIFISNKIDEELSDSIEDDKFIEDEDEYYDILGYKNPNDPRIFVSDPMNSMQMVVNRGNKKGKILFAVINMFLVFVIVFFGALLFEKDWKVEVSDSIKISTILYKDTVNSEEIESIELLEKFPNKRTFRINGTAMERKSYGNFSIEGEGNIRLYRFNKTDKIIKITRKNKKSIYVNKRTNEETEKLFEDLKNFKNK